MYYTYKFDITGPLKRGYVVYLENHEGNVMPVFATDRKYKVRNFIDSLLEAYASEDAVHTSYRVDLYEVICPHCEKSLGIVTSRDIVFIQDDHDRYYDCERETALGKKYDAGWREWRLLYGNITPLALAERRFLAGDSWRSIACPPDRWVKQEDSSYGSRGAMWVEEMEQYICSKFFGGTPLKHLAGAKYRKAVANGWRVG